MGNLIDAGIPNRYKLLIAIAAVATTALGCIKHYRERKGKVTRVSTPSGTIIVPYLELPPKPKLPA